MQSFRILTPKATEVFTIGRKDDNSLVLKNPMVSRYHAKIVFENDWILINLSKNSITQVNGISVLENDSYKICHGDVLLLGPLQLRASLKNNQLQLLLMESTGKDLEETISVSKDWKPLKNIPVEIPQDAFARVNAEGFAEIKFKNYLVDFKNKRCKILKIKSGESVKLLGAEISFKKSADFLGELTFKNSPLGFAVKATNLNVFAGKKCLLKNINFELPEGEILAIIGRSGQGKSTLLKLLDGTYKCGKNSEVTIGTLDYRNSEIRKRIAFLEQENDLRKHLTVKETLIDGARVSMSKEEFKSEGKGRLEKFAELFKLRDRQNNFIKTLSGGECRRVALAKELMGNPGLIILDEPLSGLDPYNAKILCNHLKELSFLGHTIILTTHSYEALEIANKVLVLHKGGECFYGSPHQCFSYFNTTSPEEILFKLTDDSCDRWNDFIKKSSTKTATNSLAFYFYNTKKMPMFFYKIKLTFVEWFRDKGKFFTLILQPLIIGFLFSQIFSPRTSLWIVSFALILSANWLSISISIREIVQEKNLLKTEFRKGVNVFSTLISKAALPTITATIQTFIVYIFISKSIDHSLDFIKIMPAILLMVLPPIGISLMISALSKNSGQANALLPLIIIPQVALSGALVPLDQMHAIAYSLSYLIWSRFSQTSLLNIYLEQKSDFINTLLPLALTFCFYIVLYIILLKLKKAK